MTTREQHQPNGVPTWLDFWVKDPEANRKFWIDLMGYDIQPGEEQWGGYTVARQQRDETGLTYVFGIGPAVPGAQHDQAAMYFATDDVDGSVEKAKSLGATVLIEPNDVPEHGRWAALTDPTGAVFALWKAAGVGGYGAVDEPGFPTWQDCVSTDPAKAREFYTGLFGYDVDEEEFGAALFKLGDDAHFMCDKAPEGAQSHWVTYLHVDDIEERIARVKELGGSLTTGPHDLPFGRWAHLETPGGAPFGFFESNGQTGEQPSA